MRKQISSLQLRYVRRPDLECEFTGSCSNLLELNVYGQYPHIDIGFMKCLGKIHLNKCSGICHWK